jgi:hypothetical protein
MNLVVTSDPESIAVAIDLERRTEQAMVEQSLAATLACKVTESGFRRLGIHLPAHLTEALRRQRENAVPRLRAVAEGRGGEGEPVRIHAAAFLREVDPSLGFRALLCLLESVDPLMLSETLHQLSYVQYQIEDDRLEPADFVPGMADLERLLALLDHPDENVARRAIILLDDLKPAGVHDHHFLPRLDDPVHGKVIRRRLACEGRATSLLERAYASLDKPGRTAEDDEAVKLLERFARSDDPINAPRAAEMIKVLLGGDRLLPKERAVLEDYLGTVAHIRGALRPEHLVKAMAQVERLVGTGIIGRAAAEEALVRLRSDPEGNWELVDCWGTIETLRAEGILRGINYKADDFPPAHDDLIRDLAGISRGTFAPEGVYQLRGEWEWNRGCDEYPVQFVHRGRLYRFDSDMFRTYDLNATLEAANLALENAGEPGRFVILGVSCPQDAMVAFCDPSALEPIARELGLNPRVPFATSVGSVCRMDDASRHRGRRGAAGPAGDPERSSSIA